MRMLPRSLTVILFTMLSLLLTQQPAAAESASLGLFPSLLGIAPGDTVSVDITVSSLASDPTFDVTALLNTSNASAPAVATQLAPGDLETMTATLTLTTADAAECATTGSLYFSVLVLWDDVSSGAAPLEVVFTVQQPCSVLVVEPTSVTPNPPLQLAACGPNNDVINLPPQPLGVDVVPAIGWSGGMFMVQFFPLEGYVFPPGTQTTYTFTDINGPCSIVPPTVLEVCGPDNDIVTIPEQSEAVIVTVDSAWAAGTYTVVFSPAASYTLDPAVPFTYTFIDEADPCGIVPVEPVQTALCGPDNDTIIIPAQPPHVVLASDTTWVAGARTITFAAEIGFVLDPGAVGEFTFTDDNLPCPTEPAGSTPTPTVVPTVEPTSEPTVTATVQPTLQPTVQPTTPPVVTPVPAAVSPPAVTGLPNTGSGPGTGTWLVSASLMTLGALALGVSRKRAS